MTKPPEIGSQAPDFSLPSPAGRLVRLSDLRGQWVVVYFYQQDGAKDCTAEAVEFSELLREFHERGCAVLGISPDSDASHMRFVNACRLMVPLLSDDSLEAIQAYGAWRPQEAQGGKSLGVARSTYLIDPQGVIRAVWPEVRTASGHAAEVLAKLKELTDADGT